MTPRSIHALVLGLALLPLSSCGPKGMVSAPEGYEKLWSEMSEAERMEVMATVVTPKMRKLFQAQDPERFADFGCATCHKGEDKVTDYSMPNPELPTLYTDGFYKKHRKEHGDMVKFMWQKVEPAMGEALGVTYSFGGHIECATCHVEVGEEE